ncbi:MAG: hypothetical protein M1479_04165 [Actinobacteria bacterium]|nr:hypothetical protein [Cyanobacteriota bacterium]MCL5771451.1 hypothetical protein [Actinomycetota bacterium]
MKKIKNKKTENLLNKTSNATQNLYINLVPCKRLFLAIFIISAASLSFEIIITRISSIIFTFNYAFILVSLAILGLGCGGREVLLGLVNKVGNITAVEVNKDFVDIVKDHMDYNGGIYTDFKNVDVVVKEGRDFIRMF